MMLLIDEEELFNKIANKYIPKELNYYEKKIVGDILYDFLETAPTAYDIDKVVEQLEGLRMIYFLTIANTGEEKNDFAYKKVGNAIDKAIEIVKAGGINAIN